MTKKKGRPPFYKTPEVLQAAVDRYFKSCEGTPVFDKNGLPVITRKGKQKIINETPPTLSGLSLFLGFKDRQQFTRQRLRGADFAQVVTIARLRVEAYTEARLFDADTYQGAAFMLRTCFGWGKDTEPTGPAGVQIIVKESDGSPATAEPSAHIGTNIELLN